MVTIIGSQKRRMLATFGFLQDGATCNTAEATLDVLRPVFEDRIISRKADLVWPPRSCDLTPLDYYLWGIVEDKCYVDKPETIEPLKDNIREAIGEIQLHTIENGDRYRGMLNEFLFTKIEKEAIYGFNRTVLRVTQPKLHSMFCALFLKIALSAAKLILFGQLEAAI